MDAAEISPNLPSVNRRIAQLLFNTQQLVVLTNSIRSTCGAGLDLTRIGGHRNVGNGGILGFP